MKELKNDLFLQALRGEKVSRPPVWFMRQAGRYLPKFREIRSRYSFFERCETPDLVSEITLMPVHAMGVDAAILFSDILVIPRAMGVDVSMQPNIGPVLSPIKSERDIARLVTDVETPLKYVFDGIKQTKSDLHQRVPLIGFAGSPWTLLCYMIEGSGSKNFQKAKSFIYKSPELAHMLLEKLSLVTIKYLRQKIASGCDAIQLFDSWGGLLSPSDFEVFSLNYMRKIFQETAPLAPGIVFAKGCDHSLEKIATLDVQGVGLDWTTDPKKARVRIPNLTLQGNLDPCVLFASTQEIQKRTKQMVRDFGTQRYIANLGHGILPEVLPEHAKAFVDSVKESKSN